MVACVGEGLKCEMRLLGERYLDVVGEDCGCHTATLM